MISIFSNCVEERETRSKSDEVLDNDGDRISKMYDCDDNDPSKWMEVHLYEDKDGDHFGSG